MIPAKIEVVVDEQLVKEEIRKQIDTAIISQLWFCDANKIAELCCLSVRFLEEHVFSDYRMRAIQIQKNRKRIWRADKALDVISEILQEW